MRMLLSKKSRRELMNYLKDKNQVHSLKELAKKLKFSSRVMESWFYNLERYLPESIIPLEIKENLEIVDKQEDNWGEIKGGKMAYKKIIEKYGEEEMIRRRLNAIIKSKNQMKKSEKEFEIDINNPIFLEFYGVLMGDGWLSKFKWKNKITYVIGVSGDKRYDNEFYTYLKDNIKILFNRDAYIRERKYNNSMELKFSHKMLIKLLNEELNFPIGTKSELKIPKSICEGGFEKTKHVIRGIFDTDGSFCLDKTPAGHPYPCISIEMKEPKLIKQLYDILIDQGFRVSYKLGTRDKFGIDRITLKGRKQLNKWMLEIGSSNQRHLRKINGLVTQPG